MDIDVVTCSPDDLIRHVAPRSDADGCVVVNDNKIVLGRLGPREITSAPDLTVEAVMQPGPATVRANEPLDELLSRMAEHHVPTMIVTTPEGQLLGVVRRTDEERHG